ncbi:MAG: histidine phosphatase family protein [Armatimonadetes bacterium]|nr:histidine phosphatase family protein [Armatimonadota bacterium]MDE2206531.1 histidine phosphatase family protein [Armatimonadota bacterium]
MNLNSVSRVLIVRHGETAWNLEGRIQGQTDVCLSPAGVVQAGLLADRIARDFAPVSAIYSSDLRRASQTAAAISLRCGAGVVTDPRLREYALGRWEGLTANDIAANGEAELYRSFRADPAHVRPPGSEEVLAAHHRMAAAWDAIAEPPPGAVSVVVGHGGSLALLLSRLLGADIESAFHLELSNASLSVVRWNTEPAPRRLRVVLLNCTAHLNANHALQSPDAPG